MSTVKCHYSVMQRLKKPGSHIIYQKGCISIPCKLLLWDFAKFVTALTCWLRTGKQNNFRNLETLSALWSLNHGHIWCPQHHVHSLFSFLLGTLAVMMLAFWCLLSNFLILKVENKYICLFLKQFSHEKPVFTCCLFLWMV